MGGSALMVFEDLDVEALAQIANESAEEVENSARKTVEHAERCGRALLAAKEKLPHGQWSAWLAKNFDYDHRHATRYMTIASNWSRVSNLEHATSIREALRMIAEDPETPKRERKPSVQVVEPSKPSPKPVAQTRDRSEPTGEQATLAVNREETRKAPAHRPPEKFSQVAPSYQDDEPEEDQTPVEVPAVVVARKEQPPPPDEPRDLLEMFEDMKQLVREAMHEFPENQRSIIWRQLVEQLSEEDVQKW